ncbi:hypothetical protein ACSRUE_00855 [Sorangium sp. KYC3313]|uniref:hypothetical protein n=1 Tax=Sorangium sp. KYC3313 TaxID=3449740 RepID=UPI003F899DA1
MVISSSCSSGDGSRIKKYVVAAFARKEEDRAHLGPLVALSLVHPADLEKRLAPLLDEWPVIRPRA